MGQKINPFALRVGINKPWISRWVANDYQLSTFLKEDYFIRQFLLAKLPSTFIAKIEIERHNNKVFLLIFSSNLGIIFGQKGENIKKVTLNLKKQLWRKFRMQRVIKVEIKEIKNPGLNAQLVANDIAKRINLRESYRNLQREAIKNAIRLGAKGIKVSVAGRLNGADIARKSHLSQGKIPLSTLKADIDYGFAESPTKYGRVSVKTWIYFGNVKIRE